MFGAEFKSTTDIPSNCYYPADLELFPSEIYGNRQLNSIVTINQTYKLELTFDKKGNVKKGLMYVLDEVSKTWSEYAQFGYTFDANGKELRHRLNGDEASFSVATIPVGQVGIYRIKMFEY